MMQEPSVTATVVPSMAIGPADLHRGYTLSTFGQLHYMIARPAVAHGPPLLLLHQNPSSINEYLSFAREMARDRNVIAFDTPGCGMSDPPPEPVAIGDYARSFAQGLDALDAAVDGKIDVFGFHTGAYLAVELALIRPDLVGRVILSGIPFRTGEERLERLIAARESLVLDEDGSQVFEFLRAMWTYSVVMRHPKTPIKRSVELFLERIRSMQRANWAYVGVWSYDPEEQLPKIRQPVLVLQSNEPLLTYSRAAATLIPDAQFVELAHLDADVFEHGIQDFARGIRNWKAVSF